MNINIKQYTNCRGSIILRLNTNIISWTYTSYKNCRGSNFPELNTNTFSWTYISDKNCRGSNIPRLNTNTHSTYTSSIQQPFEYRKHYKLTESSLNSPNISKIQKHTSCRRRWQVGRSWNAKNANEPKRITKTQPTKPKKWNQWNHNHSLANENQ